MEQVLGLQPRRDALAAARDALTEIASVLWQASGAELGPVLKEIDDLGRLLEAARVAVIDEALGRGEMRSYTGPTPQADERPSGEPSGDRRGGSGVGGGVLGAGVGAVVAGGRVWAAAAADRTAAQP